MKAVCLEPHLDVGEQRLYGGQALGEDEGSVEARLELLSPGVDRPLAAPQHQPLGLVALPVLPARRVRHGAGV